MDLVGAARLSGGGSDLTTLEKLSATTKNGYDKKKKRKGGGISRKEKETTLGQTLNKIQKPSTGEKH